ncbi:MAG: transcription factor S [Candidatus Methanofastidiosa archaeon]|nr:transcription factor S [Candidatus Methanofastidiosa archaeon]
MEFCPECGSLMMPSKKGSLTIITCKKCGYCRDLSKEDKSKFVVKEKISHSPKDKLIVIEDKVDTLPKTREQCPKCGNFEAYWWELQTRSGDEPSTKFYRCTRCGHTWREY